jgi:hypothetical protein
MAMMEMKHVLSMVLPKYKFTLNPDFVVKPVKAITVSANALPVTVQHR